MQRIDTSTKALDLFGTGKHGFRAGNLSSGIAPTDLSADWFNGVQEELLAIIEAASITPNSTVRNQALLALRAAGVFTTASPGDNTTRAATTAFVQAALAAVSSADAGKVDVFARNSPPTGWLKANGAAVSRTTYAVLFSAIGTTFGTGDGSTTFNVPDLRGEFLRGWDDARGVDSGRAFGSAQAMAIRASTLTQMQRHGTNAPVSTNDLSFTENSTASMTLGSQGGAGTITLGSGTETRPRNVALLVCIKY